MDQLTINWRKSQNKINNIYIYNFRLFFVIFDSINTFNGMNKNICLY